MTIAEHEVMYPVQLEADVVLRNGRTLRIRPVRVDDHDRLRAFFMTLSPETLHARFFAMCTPDQALLYAPASVDYVHEFGVVGEVGDRIVAVAHYFASPRHPSVAEVAFAIADDQQGCGIGTLLLEKLAAAGRMNHIERFEAELLSETRGCSTCSRHPDSTYCVEPTKGPFTFRSPSERHRHRDEIRLREVKANETFVSPKPPATTKSDPKVTKIVYSVPDKQLSVVKRKLHARTAKEAGQRTFDYYYEMEWGEDG